MFKHAEKHDNYTFVNLTPHPVNIYDRNNNCVLFVLPEDQPVRLTEQITDFAHIGQIPLSLISLGQPSAALPPVQPNTFYIVSRFVADTAKERFDFLYPGPLVRDDQGRVLGSIGLCPANPSIKKFMHLD